MEYDKKERIASAGFITNKIYLEIVNARFAMTIL